MARLVIMPASWASSDVSDSAFRLLAVICTYAHVDGAGCWRAGRDLAAQSRMSESTYKRAMRELKAAGLVRVQARFVDGRQTTNVIVPAWDITGAVGAVPDPEGVTGEPLEGVADGSPEGVTGDIQKHSEGITPKESKIPKGQKKASEPSPEFLEAWAAYPRTRDCAKAKAWSAWGARLAEGHTPAEIIAGIQRYAAHVRRERIEQQFVKRPETFLGPGRHFEAGYEPAPAEPFYGPDGHPTPAFFAWEKRAMAAGVKSDGY
jgi:hypothetical protein